MLPCLKHSGMETMGISSLLFVSLMLSLTSQNIDDLKIQNIAVILIATIHEMMNRSRLIVPD